MLKKYLSHKSVNHKAVNRIQLRVLKRRFFFLIFGVICLFSILFIRTFMLQILKNPLLEKLAKRQFETKMLIKPMRGIIYDRHQEPLAISLEVNSLAANPNKLIKIQSQEIQKMIQKFQSILRIPAERLKRKLAEKKEFVWIKRHLSDAQVIALQKILMFSEAADAFWFVKESDRMYPHDGLAATLIGDVNIDNEGVEGIELGCNHFLKGDFVQIFAFKDARGRPTFFGEKSPVTSNDGKAIHLTIDYLLQFEVEKALKESMTQTRSSAGVVIIMDASNGEILALANEPSFQRNSAVIELDKRRNRAITDGFEPGSILKPLVLAAALEEKFYLSDTVWGERGLFTIQGKTISEAEAHEKFEWLSLEEVITVSSNIGAAKMALKIGAKKLRAHLLKYGFGAKTGILFPGEIAGKVPVEWSDLLLANIGFGHGLFVTPLQMIQAYGAIFNGGFLNQPRLIKSAQKNFSKRIFSSEVANQVIQALLTVTQPGGTGVKANVAGFHIAGKTGTAQMVDPNTKRYSKTKYVSSFIGGAIKTSLPAVILTVLWEPQQKYYASQTTAPLFKKVFHILAKHYKLQPDLPDSFAPTYLAEQEIKKITFPEHLVPNLLGLSFAEVLHQYPSMDWKAEGFGVITSQSVLPGSPWPKNKKIRLSLKQPQ